MSELLPCPFCKSPLGGSIGTYLFYYEYGDEYQHFIECPACEARGSAEDDEQEAIDAWNRRAPEWISVKDRLPESITRRCLIASDDGNFVHPRIALYNSAEEKWVYVLIGKLVTSKVTHWMPLPESPKE